ncbi:methyltransferase domain-containing protein [Streptomyces sp. NPDC051320]|uniref:methyltransferase domain-containing protein n=1 Tax=Streptomyces sp. NPDC051320 TaxID=3154644 RepID=UPI0034241C4B
MGAEHGADMGAEQELRAALVREIAESGALADPAWRAAFAEVPRHLFVPYFFAGGFPEPERLWGEDSDPERRARWLKRVYTDEALATRMRDGELISSSSQPSLMARMLHRLDVRDGDAVLEIGTGSGYNAALLAHRLGDARVTTVDLDPEITESARRHLRAAGYAPAVVTGDGAGGCPGRGPFDAIIATCELPSVPRAWLAQCRPGARILAPLSTGLILLRVRDAEHAEGRFLRTPAYFVPLRGGSAQEATPQAEGLPGSAGEDDLFRFLLTLTGGSLQPADALSLWERAGRPQRERYGITLSDGREWAWLDDPDGPWGWPLGPQSGS